MSTHFSINRALAPETVSLHDLVGKWTQHYRNSDTTSMTALMLTGTDGGRELLVNCLKDRETREIPLLEQAIMTRDYDSGLGVSLTLPYNHPMEVFVSGPPNLTLKADNHMTYSITQDGATHEVKLSSIPNVAIGRVDRCLIRLMCPGKWANNHPVEFSVPDKEVLFNRGLKPAIDEIYSDRHEGGGVNAFGQWPLTFQIGSDTLPDHRSSAFTTRQVKSEEVSNFGQHLLFFLGQAGPDFAGCFFYHEIQGVKMAFEHDPDDSDEREHHLHQGMLKHFRHDMPPRTPVHNPFGGFPEEWNIDVALTWGIESHVVTWLAGSHVDILQLSFPNTPISDIRSEHRSSRYREDRVSHLRDVAGMLYVRGSSRRISERDIATLVSLYGTDKNLWFKRGETSPIYKRFYPSSVLEDANFDKMMTCLTRRADNVCRGGGVTGDDHGSNVQTGSARFEIRVPASDAAQIHYSVPDGFATSYLTVSTPKLFWAFRFARILACLHVLSLFKNMPVDVQRGPRSLTLIPNIMYILAGILRRDPGGQWERLTRLKMQLPLDDDGRDYDGEDPANHRGCLFMAGLSWNETEGTEYVRVLQNHALGFPTLVRSFFPSRRADGSHRDILDLMKYFQDPTSILSRAPYGGWAQLGKRKRNANRTNNRTSSQIGFWHSQPHPPDWPVSLVVDVESRVAPYLGVDRRIINPPASQRDHGRQLSPDPMAFNPEMVQEAEMWVIDGKPITQLVQESIRQFVVDIIRLSPNRKNMSEASHLTIMDRNAYGPSLMTKLDFRGMAHGLHVLPVSDSEFRKRAETLFPKRAKHMGGVENALYPLMIGDLLNRVRLDLGDLVHQSIVNTAFQFLWLPWGEGGMWKTRSKPVSRLQEWKWITSSDSGGWTGRNSTLQLDPMPMIIIKAAFSISDVKVGPGFQPFIGKDGRIGMALRHGDDQESEYDSDDPGDHVQYEDVALTDDDNEAQQPGGDDDLGDIDNMMDANIYLTQEESRDHRHSPTTEFLERSIRAPSRSVSVPAAMVRHFEGRTTRTISPSYSSSQRLSRDTGTPQARQGSPFASLSLGSQGDTSSQGRLFPPAHPSSLGTERPHTRPRSSFSPLSSVTQRVMSNQGRPSRPASSSRSNHDSRLDSPSGLRLQPQRGNISSLERQGSPFSLLRPQGHGNSVSLPDMNDWMRIMPEDIDMKEEDY